jgi:type IV pilus assembly protein PilA
VFVLLAGVVLFAVAVYFLAFRRGRAQNACAKCGALVAMNTAFCAGCGAAVGSAGTNNASLERPTLIAVLAVMQFMGAALWLLIGLGGMIAGLAGGGPQPEQLVAVWVLIAIGILEVACGIGLWKLKPYGRTLQLAFAWIGLLAFPFGTVIGILILVYLFKPGIKVLFAGRPAADLTEAEWAQVGAVSHGSIAVVVVVLVVVLGSIAAIGVIAAIAVPGLLRARMAGNEASAIGSLRAINSAQATYASTCAGGGYAVALDDLVKAPTATSVGFLSPDLSRNGVTKSGYTFTLAKDAAPRVIDIGAAASTCNASSANPASSYFAQAEPVTPGSTGARYFATDASGVIFQSTTPIVNPIVQSATVVAVE